MTGTVANTAVALLPVLLFLGALVLMDSFKLARPRAIALALAWGVISALLAGVAQAVAARTIPLPPPWLDRVAGPLTEETAKAAFIAYLILRRRIGFPVDAAQMGFAVGTGFAVVENLEYLRVLGDASFVVWCVRGLGAGMLHGATTAIFAMMSHTAAERHRDRHVIVFVPAWITALALHAAFNLVPVSRLATTAVLLLLLPLIVLWVFARSERATREWVGAGLDLDLMLHDVFSSDTLEYTKFGAHLQALRQRFAGPVVADMLCLLRIELELSIQAKALLIARDAGVAMPTHPDARSAVAEVRYLRSAIGTTGLLALGPIHVSSWRDDWHRYVLLGSDSTESRWFRFVRSWRSPET